MKRQLRVYLADLVHDYTPCNYVVPLNAGYLSAYLTQQFGLLTKKNAINVLMSIELIFNSANINLIAFSRFVTGDAEGQIFALFVIAIAAAEAALAVAIFINLYRNLQTVEVQEVDQMKY